MARRYGARRARWKGGARWKSRQKAVSRLDGYMDSAAAGTRPHVAPGRVTGRGHRYEVIRGLRSDATGVRPLTLRQLDGAFEWNPAQRPGCCTNSASRRTSSLRRSAGRCACTRTPLPGASLSARAGTGTARPARPSPP